MLKRTILSLGVFWCGVFGLFVGCGKEKPAPEYVARVGDRYLTRGQVTAALESMPAGVDTTEAHRQIVEQWVTNTLLFQEAERRGLREDAEVQHLLEENERSVLVSALLARLYDEVPASPTPAEIQAYYDRHKEQLQLREPYVRVRYLANRSPDSAEAARRLMQQMPPPQADSLWADVVARFAHDPDGSLELSASYFPESQLLAPAPAVQLALTSLEADQISPVIRGDSLYHLVQLVERLPAGSIPDLDWVEGDLTRRMAIQARKQIYARQVERLRNEALAREDLDMPE